MNQPLPALVRFSASPISRSRAKRYGFALVALLMALMARLALDPLLEGTHNKHAFITFIVAIVLGFVARTQIRNSGGRQKGDGLAIAGIIIGFAWVAFYVLIIIVGAVSNNSNTSVISLLGAVGHIA